MNGNLLCPILVEFFHVTGLYINALEIMQLEMKTE